MSLFFFRVKNTFLYGRSDCMKGNIYWNTIWSERDGEFYWSGLKHGFLCAAILIPCTYVTIRVLVNEFKELNTRQETESE